MANDRVRLKNMAINLEEILNLPIIERLELVSSIWDSIAEESASLELTDAQRRMLDERLNDLSESPDSGSPWPEVKARILATK